MTSLRRQLTVGLVAALGLMLLVLVGGVRWSTGSWLEREFDRALEASGRALVTLTKEIDGELELDFAGEYMPEFELERGGQFFELILPTSEVLERSDSLEALDENGREVHLERRLEFHLDPERFSTTRFVDVVLPDGRRGRQAEVLFVPQLESDEDEDDTVAPPSSEPLLLLVAKERETLDTRLRNLNAALLLGIVVTLCGIAVIVSGLVRVTLRPLARLRSEVESVEADSLGRMVSTERLPAEIRPVARSLNELLVRLDESFQREKRLSADLAHELRTPIAELRNLAEVGAKWPDDRESVQRFFHDVRDISLAMEAASTSLIDLARLEAGTRAVLMEELEIRPLIDRIWRGRDGQQLAASIPSDFTISTDRALFGMLFQNLLRNAATHAPERDIVELRALTDAAGKWGHLAIENTAPELSESELELMFQRFWRKDEARTQSEAQDKNLGIGLALVKEITRILGYSLSARLGPDFRLVIEVGNIPMAGGNAAPIDREKADEGVAAPS